MYPVRYLEVQLRLLSRIGRQGHSCPLKQPLTGTSLQTETIQSAIIPTFRPVADVQMCARTQTQTGTHANPHTPQTIRSINYSLNSHLSLYRSTSVIPAACARVTSTVSFGGSARSNICSTQEPTQMEKKKGNGGSNLPDLSRQLQPEHMARRCLGV